MPSATCILPLINGAYSSKIFYRSKRLTTVGLYTLTANGVNRKGGFWFIQLDINKSEFKLGGKLSPVQSWLITNWSKLRLGLTVKRMTTKRSKATKEHIVNDMSIPLWVPATLRQRRAAWYQTPASRHNTAVPYWSARSRNNFSDRHARLHLISRDTQLNLTIQNGWYLV